MLGEFPGYYLGVPDCWKTKKEEASEPQHVYKKSEYKPTTTFAVLNENVKEGTEATFFGFLSEAFINSLPFDKEYIEEHDARLREYFANSILSEYTSVSNLIDIAQKANVSMLSEACKVAKEAGDKYANDKSRALKESCGTKNSKMAEACNKLSEACGKMLKEGCGRKACTESCVSDLEEACKKCSEACGDKMSEACGKLNEACGKMVEESCKGTKSCSEGCSSALEEACKKCSEACSNLSEAAGCSESKDAIADGINYLKMNSDELSSVVKKKVIDVVAKEKEQAAKEKEMFEEIKQASLSESVLVRNEDGGMISPFKSFMIKNHKEVQDALRANSAAIANGVSTDYGTLSESASGAMEINVNMDKVLGGAIVDYTREELLNTVGIKPYNKSMAIDLSMKLRR